MWFWLKWTLSLLSPRASDWSWDDLVGRGVSRTLSKRGWVILSEKSDEEKREIERGTTAQEHNGGGKYSSLVQYRDTMPYWDLKGTRDDCARRLAEFSLMPFFYLQIICFNFWQCATSVTVKSRSTSGSALAPQSTGTALRHLELIMMRLSSSHGDPHLSSPAV